MSFSLLDLPTSGLVLIVGSPQSGKSRMLADIVLFRMRVIEQQMFVFADEQLSADFLLHCQIAPEFIHRRYSRSECKRLLMICEHRTESQICLHPIEIYVDDLDMFRSRDRSIDPYLQEMAICCQQFSLFMVMCSREFYTIPYQIRRMCDLMILTSGGVSGRFGGVDLACYGRRSEPYAVDQTGQVRFIEAESPDPL